MAANTQELNDNVKIDLLQLSCNSDFVCPYNERTLSYAIGINTPPDQVTPDEIFKECCYRHYVFADASSDLDFKNDYSGFYHQRQLATETVEFFLFEFDTSTEHDLDDATYGQFFGFGSFPSNTDLSGYRVDWKKVLTVLGPGSYKIITRHTIAGLAFERESFVFTLEQYSSRRSNRTVRIDVVMNGLLRKDNIDFTGTNWKHSIRIPGFFGNREAQYEEDNLVNRNFEKRQISMSQTNEYKFQTNLIPDCVTKEILDFIIFGNDIFMNDYNLNNHTYSFQKFGVKYASNEGTDYGPLRRKARLNLVFNDKFLNNRKNNFY